MVTNKRILSFDENRALLKIHPQRRGLGLMAGLRFKMLVSERSEPCQVPLGRKEYVDISLFNNLATFIFKKKCNLLGSDAMLYGR
jgi:hypothetical protein